MKKTRVITMLLNFLMPLAFGSMIPNALLAQDKVIKGQVVDSNDEPIPGVTVSIPGTSIAVATDLEGGFVVEKVPVNALLVFKSVGYKQREVAASATTDWRIVMEDDVAGLDEVIVVGYGTAKKSDLTGAVSRVNATDFQNQSVTQLTDMLAGTVAGFQANQATSAAGGTSMEIRGVNSINASTSPMVVLDGVIYNGDIGDINPNDIESVDILKDASSAAVYGARAANGVMLVTTKKGITGKPTISFATKQGLAEATSKEFGARDPQNYLDFRRDFLRTLGNAVPDFYYDNPNALGSNVSLDQWRNASANPNPDDTREWLSRLNFFAPEVESFNTGNTVDWVDEVLQKGRRQEYDLSISGGTENMKYFWSVGYLDNEGIVIGDRFKNVRSRVNLDNKVASWLNVGLNLQYSYRDQGVNSPYAYSNEDPVKSMLSNMYQVSPFASIYEPDGTINFYPHGYIRPNPLINVFGQDRDHNVQSLFASIYSEVKLPFGITYRLSFQPRTRSQKDYNFWSTETIMGRETYSNGYATRDDVTSFEWMVDNLLKWNQTFGVHNFDVTLLYNAEHFRSWSSRMGNQSFQPSPTLGYGGLQFGNNPFLNTNDIKYTGDGLMARVNYALMDKYLLTASVRRDGFSGFGQENPYATFPAAAVAWQVHKEKFFNIPAIDQFKLRASWGKNGNRDIGPYASFAQMQSVQYYDGTNPVVGIFTSSLANPALSWEETESMNFGADITLFNNRLNLTLEYYDAKTNRLLVDRSLPTITGFDNVTTNIGALANKGFEMTLSSLNMQRPNFTWRSTVNFSFNRNKITSLFGETGTYTLAGQTLTGEIPDYSNRWFVGQPLDVIWDYKVEGIWQVEEAAEAAQYGLEPGDYKVADLDGNLVYEALQDKQFIGYEMPRYLIGFRNEFSFLRDFTATIFLRADLGHKRQVPQLVEDYSTYDRRSTANFDYWTPENRSNEYPRLSRNMTGFGGNLMPYWNTSFLRVQDVTLSYTLPTNLTDRLRAKSARLFFSARNLLTFSDWPAWDPESTHDAAVGQSPMPKIYTLGLNITL